MCIKKTWFFLPALERQVFFLSIKSQVICFKNAQSFLTARRSLSEELNILRREASIELRMNKNVMQMDDMLVILLRLFCQPLAFTWENGEYKYKLLNYFSILISHTHTELYTCKYNPEKLSLFYYKLRKVKLIHQSTFNYYLYNDRFVMDVEWIQITKNREKNPNKSIFFITYTTDI